jgi:hypothetical protein
VIDPLGLDERGQVGGDPVDGLEGGRLGGGDSPVAEPGDRRAGAEGRPGSDAGPRRRPGRRGRRRSIRRRRPPSSSGTPPPTRERALPDVVPADDESSRPGQVEAVEERERRDQAGRRRQATRAKRREAERDGRAHAAEGADHQRPTRRRVLGGFTCGLASSGGGSGLNSSVGHSGCRRRPRAGASHSASLWPFPPRRSTRPYRPAGLTARSSR